MTTNLNDFEIDKTTDKVNETYNSGDIPGDIFS